MNKQMKKMVRLVEIKTDETFIIDMMYAGTENMMQTAVYQEVGLGNRCFVHPDLAQCLKKLQPLLQERGLKLKICDAYRPVQAFYRMKEIIPMQGFFAATAERSQHCHASAIDAVLTDSDGCELKFPCRVDAYEPKYAQQIRQGQWDEFRQHLEKAKYSWNEGENSESIKNRTMFRALMEQAGFEALEHEWWHFNLPHKENYPLIDCECTKGNEIKFFVEENT